MAAHADDDPPKIKPEGPVWTVAPDFAFNGDQDEIAKKRRSLSGIACPAPSESPRLCIAAFDEGGEARYVIVGPTGFTPQQGSITLRDDDKEVDAEGAARDGSIVYITGSHSPKRGPPCKVHEHSRHVYRFKVDVVTGLAVSAPEDAKKRLWKALQKSKLGKFVEDDECHNHAVNIEGLAAKAGDLFFGLREPSKDKTAYIVKVGADALFGTADLDLDIYQFDVGGGRGIRDLLAVPEGVLMLLGPDDDEGNKKVSWRIALWDRDGLPSKIIEPKLLAQLDLEGLNPNECGDNKNKDGDLKPEAMTMLGGGADFYRLLILSDGMCNGGPLSFRIQKRSEGNN
jgi:hypothetical protein